MPAFTKLTTFRSDNLAIEAGIHDTLRNRRTSSLQRHGRTAFGLIIASLFLYILSGSVLLRSTSRESSKYVLPPDILARCRALNVKPGPPEDFYKRKESDRFVPGTNATLIVNATIWTGNANGTEDITGDVLLDGGLIKWIGKDLSHSVLQKKQNREFDLDIIDAKGAWLTPGIIDVHSHIAVGSAPGLTGADDTNSVKGPTQPWLRSLDGLNTHDASYALAISGGVTTSLILPGSAGAIGGQAFAIKMRHTTERTPTSLLLEPAFGTNGSAIDYNVKPRWRHMKHACGENPSRSYGQTRMDTAWQFRTVYDIAHKIKESQDNFCEKALAGKIDSDAKFPGELQWEAAVDILRGKVRVHTHCYEAVDLDNFVRLSNEFQFPVAAFHHAHETYLVPDLLKKTYEDVPPASAMFASFSRYKREAYRHSVYAPRILHDAGLRVVMKSDHGAIVSRYLLHEAQQAHYYGLPPNIALASVTSTAAGVLGYEHRIGYIREGYDADLVLWDSHPLQLGATPQQVFIDGIAQLKAPHVVEKSEYLQHVPQTPNFDDEAKETLKHEGLPPLLPQQSFTDSVVVFTNVTSVWTVEDTLSEIQTLDFDGSGMVVTQGGHIICKGSGGACGSFAKSSDSTIVDLEGGSISPGLVSFGSDLGLQEIGMEDSTTDGNVLDAFNKDLPSILGNDAVIRAEDGLIFSTRNALLAYRAGVTSAITAPASSGLSAGLSTHFSTGAPFKATRGAVIQGVTALHVTINSVGQPSVSTQIAALRRLLTVKQEGDLGFWLDKVLKAEIPLVVNVHSADHIATLLSLKEEVESITGTPLRLTLTGASEAHLLARQLGEAGVGVILNPVRPYPATWDRRRILPGPPLSGESALLHLMRHNVTVGFGVAGGELPPAITGWAAQNARFDVSWAYIEAGGQVSKSEAIALASTNVERLLGAAVNSESQRDLVVTKGGDLLDIEAKVVGIISPQRGQVELL
ncbi:composite domain of metallo-dependent hydrolase [Fomitiporia mediterranea MF3/22]|uniref:composite domain of metallo-dependent hydrolase n=1 Tax=Fomitiporia mediterranea (strain MF3/22) TaxID=694068 RepID=UPI00044088F4|nr:composite domain of metallo-dependent hydrolase [Fomitiporia mediterranea MF3/22]EJC98798.1 composite domain of metallo-dependent hydrolase [Fomitiporia mediterranea MF3/22]